MNGLPVCTRGFMRGVNFNEKVVGTLPSGNPIYENKPSYVHFKAILCGLEYCKDCGKMHSWVHNRRISRWLPKSLQWDKKGFGYLVITFPERSRELLKDQFVLQQVRSYFRKKLKRSGYARGLGRWHWFGDCKNCCGKGTYQGNYCAVCHGTGAGKKYHPHLNLMFDEQFISPDVIDKWREQFEVAFWNIIKKNGGTFPETEYSRVNFNYRYYKPTDEILFDIWHKTTYVTRATFRLPNQGLAEKLHGCRNQFSWGKWKNLTESEIKLKIDKLRERNEVSNILDNAQLDTQKKLSSYAKKICPLSGEIIIWEKFINAIEFINKQKYIVDFVAGGFYICSPEVLENDCAKAPPDITEGHCQRIFKNAQRIHKKRASKVLK